MTLMLNLSPEQESEVRARAAQNDPEADAYLAALLRYALDVYTPEECGPAPAPGESVFDSIKEYIGTVDSAELAAASQNPGAAFANHLTEQHRHGKL